MSETEYITLTSEDGEELILSPLTQTMLAGRRYLAAEEVVPDDPDWEGEIYILRLDEEAGDGSGEDAFESCEIVEDENELNAVLVLLRDDLEDLGIIVEV